MSSMNEESLIPIQYFGCNVSNTFANWKTINCSDFFDESVLEESDFSHSTDVTYVKGKLKILAIFFYTVKLPLIFRAFSCAFLASNRRLNQLEKHKCAGVCGVDKSIRTMWRMMLTCILFVAQLLWCSDGVSTSVAL